MSNTSIQRDAMLDIVKTNYALTASQTVIAQWNHNRYTPPMAYGYYRSSSSNSTYVNSNVIVSNMYTVDTASYQATMTSSTPQILGTFSASMNSATTASLQNVVRIMFDARIDYVSDGIVDDVSEFMIQVVPKASGTDLTDFIDLDNVKLTENIYTKQELLFAADYFDTFTLFDQIQLKIIPLNDIAGLSATVKVSIKNICITPVSSDEGQEGQFERLKIPFKPNRPGDQALENSLITSSVNPITKYFIITDSFDEKIKTPELLPTFLSPFNEENYFFSPRAVYQQQKFNGHNIFVEYEKTVPSNQIYIKTQNFINDRLQSKEIISSISKCEVYIKTDSGWSSTSIYSETSNTSDIIKNGAMVLQYNGSTWSSGYNKNTLPQLNTNSGSISNIVNIKGIHVVFYTNSESARMRIVELSPRLALNLDNFVISTDYEQMIDEGNQKVPVGLSNVGSGKISLENLPRYSNTQDYYQIFNNNDKSSLNGLIKSDTKFTVYTTISDTTTSASSATIKSFTMYATEWSNKDVQTVDITLQDYGKMLQSLPAPDLLLTNAHNTRYSGTIQKSLEAGMQLGGFSDYDITSLNTVSETLRMQSQATVPIFYTSRERKIWDFISEMCVGHQMSAYFDENGILQFRDILRESVKSYSYSSASPFYITSSAINEFIPNIVSFTVDTQADVSEISINYKQMSVSNNLYDANNVIFTDDEKRKMTIEMPTYTKESNFSTPPYSPTKPKALICGNIIADVSSTDTQIQIGDYNHIDKREARFITDWQGYGIIEGEIIAWDGIKYKFTPVPGFPTIEKIRSPEELANAVAERYNALNTTLFSIEKFQLSSSSINPFVTLYLYNAPTINVGDSILLELIKNGGRIITTLGKVLSVSSLIISISITPDDYVKIKNTKINNIKIGTTLTTVDSIFSYISVGELAISYNMTGSLCNVRRGLFGTSAMEHLSQNFKDTTAFVGYAPLSSSTGPLKMGLGVQLQAKIEPDNADNYNFGLLGNKIGYLGFKGRDNKEYDHFSFTFTAGTDLDSFGIFFGASLVETGANANYFKSNGKKSSDMGVFIEFWPATNKKNESGVEVRIGPNPNSQPYYASKQKLITDNYRTTKKVFVPSTNGSSTYKGKKGNWVTKKIVTPANSNHIEVFFVRQAISEIRVNGQKVFLTRYGNNNPKRNKYVPIPVNKVRSTFGIFSRNTDKNYTTLNIQEIQAGSVNKSLNKTKTWNGSSGGSDSPAVDSVLETYQSRPQGSRKKGSTGFAHPVKPFSLRATPLLKGIEINDEKWAGDLPYYDFYAQTISGMNGQQVVPQGSVETSIVLGTPFRGRWAHKNNINEVVYTNAGGAAEYTGGPVYGKSIKMSEDKKITRTINDYPGSEKIELTTKWSSGEGSIQNIIDDITKNINKMKTVYSVEIYGNPAICVGDYVNVHYPESGVNNTEMVVISTNNNFSDGGITTSLKLRNTHQ
jgi:hypothetical protein